MGIFETLEITEPIRLLITQNVSDAAVRAAALENGMRTMGEDGLKKVLEGHTTLDEVSRVIYLADQGAKSCPSCSTVLAKEFEYCPSCGEFVGEHCGECRRRLNPSWAWCPFCGEASQSSRPTGGRRSGQASDASDEDLTVEPTRRKQLARVDPLPLKKAA